MVFSFHKSLQQIEGEVPKSSDFFQIPKKTRGESTDALGNRVRRLKQRVPRGQRHLEEIGREGKAIKMIGGIA
jgi:hypothetical protein